MLPEKAIMAAIDIKDDFVKGALIARLASKTPGVIYRAQAVMDSSVKNLGETDEEKRKGFLAVTSHFGAAMARRIINSDDNSQRLVAKFETKSNDENDYEKMAVCADIKKYATVSEDDVREIEYVLEQLPVKELRAALSKIVDSSSVVEVITDNLAEENHNVTAAPGLGAAVRGVINPNETIRVGRLVFLVSHPDTPVMVSAKVYRQETLPDAPKPAEEILDGFSEMGVRNAFSEYAKYSGKPGSIKNEFYDQIILQSDMNYEQMDSVMDAMTSGVVMNDYEPLIDVIYKKVHGLVPDEILDASVSACLGAVIDGFGPRNLELDDLVRRIEKCEMSGLEDLTSVITESGIDPVSEDALNDMVHTLMSNQYVGVIDHEKIGEKLIGILAADAPERVTTASDDLLKEAVSVSQKFFDKVYEMAVKDEIPPAYSPSEP